MRIVIAGGGELGYLFARELCSQNDLFVIEPDPAFRERFEEFDVQVIPGSPTDIDVLRESNVDKASHFIACAHSDEANIISSLAAKQLGNPRTFCFVNKDHYFETFLGELGRHLTIDQLIWPEKLLAEDITRIISVPGAIDVEILESDLLKLLEFKLKPDHPDVGKSLRELDLPKGTLMLAIVRDGQVSIPSGASVLQAGDKTIFLGFDAAMHKLERRFSQKRLGNQTVTIVGGGNAGFILAKNLEEIGGMHTTLIENQADRCHFLAERLTGGTLVLNADGSDIEFLLAQRINESDCLVALTSSDERNLLIGLLASHMKVRKVITRCTKPRNAPLFEKTGIDVALNPRTIAIKTVVGQISSHGVNVMTIIEEGRAEILEIKVRKDFQPIALRELKLPEGVIVAAIRRKAHTIVPHGEEKVKPEDHLRVFCMSGKGEAVQRLLGSEGGGEPAR